jgi:hypothetical protein
MKNNKNSLIADLISTFDEAAQTISDYHFAGDDCEYWWGLIRASDFRAGSEMIETMIMNEDAFRDVQAKAMVSDGLEFYRRFLGEHGYEFKCLKLDILIDRVNKAEIAASEEK